MVHTFKNQVIVGFCVLTLLLTMFLITNPPGRNLKGYAAGEECELFRQNYHQLFGRDVDENAAWWQKHCSETNTPPVVESALLSETTPLENPIDLGSDTGCTAPEGFGCTNVRLDLFEQQSTVSFQLQNNLGFQIRSIHAQLLASSCKPFKVNFLKPGETSTITLTCSDEASSGPLRIIYVDDYGDTYEANGYLSFS